MIYKQGAYWCTLGKSNFWWLVKNLNSHLTTANDLQRCQHFLKKFFVCNPTSSTGFCSGALEANNTQVIDQWFGSKPSFATTKNSWISSDLWYLAPSQIKAILYWGRWNCKYLMNSMVLDEFPAKSGHWSFNSWHIKSREWWDFSHAMSPLPKPKCNQKR